MPKRKREEETADALFARHRIELYNALKSAKGFERQRLSKRLRDAKATPDKRSRIDKEIVVLKSLDLQQTAHAHLCSSLLRIKALAESERLPQEVKEGVAKPELTEEERGLLHNVTSSLYNRVEVRRVVEKAVEGLCRAVGVPVPEKRGKGKGKEKGEEKPGKKGEKVAVEEKPGKKSEKVKDGVEDGKVKEGRKDKARQGEGVEIDVEEEEKAISQLDHLLGLESDEDEEEEEEAVLVKGRKRKPTSALELDPMEITSDEEGGDEDDGELDPMEITDDEGEGGSGDEDEFEGFSDSNEGSQSSASDDEDASGAESSASSIARSPPAKKAATKTSKTTKLKPTDSTFLPTLMGGYISGSESASDIDMAPPRKNRRGQRARQAIWEKKYKETAKHLANQAAKSRDSGWDLKRGAVDGDSGKPWKRGIRNPLDRSKGSEAGAVDAPPKKPSAPRVKDDSGPLHPSWEAKKLAKAKEQLTAPYQGKKITFD